MQKALLALFITLAALSMSLWLLGAVEGRGFGCTDLYSGACVMEVQP